MQITPKVETYMIPETSIMVDPRHSFDGSIRTIGSSRHCPRHIKSSFEENYIRVTEFEPDHTQIRGVDSLFKS